MNRARLFRILLILGRLALAAIFIAAGVAKLRAPWLQFAVSLSSYKLLPDNLLEPIAKTMPWCEVALGVALLSGLFARWFSLIATLLLALFLTVIVRSWAVGLEIDCGCFGPGEAIGPMVFVRDGAMLALGIAVTTGYFLIRRAGAATQERAESASLPAMNPADAPAE